MKIGVLVALVAAAAICGCSAKSEKSKNPRWLLLESPPTPGFSEGNLATPFPQWMPVNEYASHDTCNADLQPTQNELQNPLICMARDDPRLKKSGHKEAR